MDIVDLTPAIDTGDLNFVRQMFRALVDYPNGDSIRCGGPGHLICALERVCDALRADAEFMPLETCSALYGRDAGPELYGATYAMGARFASGARHVYAGGFVAKFVRSNAGAL